MRGMSFLITDSCREYIVLLQIHNKNILFCLMGRLRKDLPHIVKPKIDGFSTGEKRFLRPVNLCPLSHHKVANVSLPALPC